MIALAAPQARCFQRRAIAHREVPSARARVLCQAQRAPKAVQEEELTPKEKVARSLAVLAATGALMVAGPALADFCSTARSNCMNQCNGQIAQFACNISQGTYICKCKP